jgi:hypothetical protein
VTVGSSAPTKEKASAMFKAEAFIKKVLNNMCERKREGRRETASECVYTHIHIHTCTYTYTYTYAYSYSYSYSYTYTNS